MKEILKPCDNRAAGCDRQVRVSIGYCCLSCSMAARFDHEVDETEHSEACNSRHERRGSTPKEA